MFLTKMHLSRRAVLRGMGAAVGLPLLDSMIPAQTRVAWTPSRLVCIEMVHGAAGSTPYGASKNYWSPAREGRDFEFSYSLEPLRGLRDYVTIVSNTDARGAEAFVASEGGADHFRSSAVFLTAAHAKQTPGADVVNGISIDQLYAQRVGRDTKLGSLALCVENTGLSGSCGFNYNCVYADTISWASAERPVGMTVNPRVAFEQVFGDGTARVRGSLLDRIGPQVKGLESKLGGSDRARVDLYLESVRSLEQRIERTEKANAAAVRREKPDAPLGVPDSWEEHVEILFELQALALEAEITRVSAFKMSRDTNNRVFVKSGVLEPFHTLSHHTEKPALIDQFAKLNRYHTGVVAAFLERLKNTPDGDGNLLDHSLVLYGSPMGDSNTHNHRRLPILLAGHASGQVQGNLHRVCSDGTPHANTLLTVLRRLGMDVERVGDSSGEVDV